MPRVIIIHGWEGNPECNWFPWLKKELEKVNFEVSIPFMPNTFHPDCTKWTQYLSKIINKPDKDTYLVGHSLGAITILKYIESLKEGESIGACILVAAFSEPIGFNELSSFFNKPLNYNKIKSKSNKIVVINSDNDHYVPLKQGKLLEEKLSAKLIILPNSGHLNEGNGFFKFPLVLELLLKFSK